MIVLKETQGDTLLGDIDGVNVTYTATYDFRDDVYVNIYVNGRLKIRDWDDGFSVVLPNQVVLNEPLLPGDSLEVEYQSGIATGGGADGGCPIPPEIVIVRPEAQVSQDIPEVAADELVPEVFVETIDKEVLADELRPVIVMSREGE